MVVFAVMLQEKTHDGWHDSLWSLYDDLDKAKKALIKFTEDADFEITEVRRFIIKGWEVE